MNSERPLTENNFDDDYDDASRIKLELEWQIQHAQHLEGLKILAGGVGHDLNNLLMTIIGNTDLISQHTSDKLQLSKSLLRIREAAGKASELTHQLFAFIGSGNVVLETLNLKRLFIDTQRMLRLTQEKQAILQIDLDDVPMMNGDVSQIIRLIMNILINASEATCSAHGRIGISLRSQIMNREELDKLFVDWATSEGEYIVLKVFDMGCGLDRDTIINMFGPFLQAEVTAKGYGMSTALELVSNQRGVISVNFDKRGERSISACFPCTDPLKNRLTGALPQKKNKSSGKTVLIVDDDPSVLETTGEMIQGLGHSVIKANDGFEAIEIFKPMECSIDCVILDLTMPEMDGKQTFSLLQGLKPDIPVILSSGYSCSRAISDFSSKGFSGFLQKPYDIVRLSEVIESVFKQ